MNSIFEKLNERKNEKIPMFTYFQFIEEEIDMSTQFLQIQKNAFFLPPYECFFSKLRDHNPFEQDFTEFTKLFNSRLPNRRL